MSFRKQLISFVLSVALAVPCTTLVLGSISIADAASIQQYGALERGYRTGYSDGYQAGWGDQLRGARAEYRSKADYQRGDRAYINAYGAIEDYRDGYRQGFEIGYQAGFERRGFESDIPSGGISRRGDGGPADVASDNSSRGTPASNQRNDNGTSESISRPIASNTEMLVELLNRLSTDVSQRGDRFEARVVEPAEYEGAIVAGKLTRVERSGKARGRAELQLDFDQIKMPGGEWTDFSAQVIEVLNRGGDDNVGDVDPEGGVRGKSTTKDDVAKVGAGAGIGAIIGAIAGGGKGAGIGAIIGASVGTAGVLTQRGKDIRLEPGQQLRIRSSSR